MTEQITDDLTAALLRKADDDRILEFLQAEQRVLMASDGAEMRVLPSWREIETDGERLGIERYADDADIISAIRAAAPDKIRDRIYFFPLGRYHFITDKDHAFSLPFIESLTYDEKTELDTMHYEQMLRYRSISSDDERVAYESYKDECKERELEIYKQSRKRSYYKVNPLKKGKQIRIYISSQNREKIEELGYKVIEQERAVNYSLWRDDKQEIEIHTDKDTSYSFMMNYNAFLTACKNDKIPNKGFYLDNDGQEVRIKQSGRPERVKVIDD